MGDFVVRDDGWVLRIVGKGRKELFVTVSDVLLRELVLYRQHLGLSTVPEATDNIGHLKIRLCFDFNSTLSHRAHRCTVKTGVPAYFKVVK